MFLLCCGALLCLPTGRCFPSHTGGHHPSMAEILAGPLGGGGHGEGHLCPLSLSLSAYSPAFGRGVRARARRRATSCLLLGLSRIVALVLRCPRGSLGHRKQSAARSACVCQFGPMRWSSLEVSEGQVGPLYLAAARAWLVQRQPSHCQFDCRRGGEGEGRGGGGGRARADCLFCVYRN